MRVSVAGGSGFIGTALVACLREMGAEVAVPDRAALAGGPPPGGWGMMVWAAGLTADFRQRPLDTVAAHVADLNAVIGRGGMEGILYLSSTRVYQRADRASEAAALPCRSEDPSDLYNLTKLTGEALCLSSGVGRVKIARLSNVTGPGEAARQTFLGALCREARAGGITLQSAPGSLKDYLWIDDAARVLAGMATDDSTGILNVAGGRQIAHRDWAVTLARQAGAALEMPDGLPETSFPPIETARMCRRYGPVRIDPLNRAAELLTD